MKTKALLLIGLLVLLMSGSSPVVYSESMDELVESFDREYEAMKPRPNSSVNADYKLAQTALGSLYTTRALNLLYKQNQEMLAKYDEILQKHREVIDQNKEIIRLLLIISKAGEETRHNR